ncbi:hypothetical protein NLI96_g5001 [Meripilus lineatus]|uniref:Aromatic-L-amino-acid decarboxylase n=1 Tax=Meripilus lineatus TaxID=2056292 RepID=A0AAD5V5K2_9APHY|nr:hypothetical protein NLI96_g5001 [Physisporinus lineatus]
MDIEQFRKAGYQAIDRICDYYYSLEKRPVSSQVQPGYLREALPPNAPEAGEVFEKIADDYQQLIIPGIGGGVIQTTASDAALVSIVAARSVFVKQHPHIKHEDLVIYTTTETHSLGQKAGLILGVRCRALKVTVEDNFALRGSTLLTALEEDSKRGKHPFIIVATVGTTSSGAIDRLDEIGQVVKSHGSIWLHVDAAWAGVALACPELRDTVQLDSINTYADSFCTNFHKWGLVNFDASALWVRNRKNLTDALDITPEFLRSKHGDEGTVIDYRNWHLGLGRRFRSLKVWFVLRSYGQEGFRKHIRQGIALNKYFVSLLRPPFTLITEPSFALSVFRLEPPSLPAEQASQVSKKSLDDLNRDFYSRVSACPDILITQTLINGMFCLRFAVGAVRTEKRHIDQAWALLQSHAEVSINSWIGS